MNKQTFTELTGENPEDMFGGDWENEIKDLEILVEGEIPLSPEDMDRTIWNAKYIDKQ